MIGKFVRWVFPEKRNARERVVVASPVGRKSYVLVVDDSLESREVLVEVLETYGYTVVGASSVNEAVEYLHQSPPPRLIITDLMMPVMNGWDLLDAKHKMEHLANVPVVVLSAVPQPKVGADHVMLKPVDIEELLAVIEPYTGGSPDEK